MHIWISRLPAPEGAADGGQGTQGPREGTTVFKTVAFNRSAIPPLYVKKLQI